MKILHIINDLGIGGAQASLLKLLKYDDCNTHYIVTLKSRGLFLSEYKKYCHDIFILDLRIYNVIFTFCKILLMVRKISPDVIQTWLYISDLIGTLLYLITPTRKLFWNIRNGTINFKLISFSSYISAHICSKLSNVPENIIINSEKAVSEHVKIGYNRKRFNIIHNGVDIKESHYSISEHDLNRCIVYGSNMRFDKQKGLTTIFKAIKNLPLDLNITFCFLGTGMSNDNDELIRMLHDFSIHHNVVLYGNKILPSEFYKKLDFHILASLSEGFPNVIAESMFIGKPNISSTAGESPFIISDTGWIFNIGDHTSLTSHIITSYRLIKTDYERYIQLCRLAHERILSKFSLNKMLKSYQRIWNTR